MALSSGCRPSGRWRAARRWVARLAPQSLLLALGAWMWHARVPSAGWGPPLTATRRHGDRDALVLKASGRLHDVLLSQDGSLMACSINRWVTHRLTDPDAYRFSDLLAVWSIPEARIVCCIDVSSGFGGPAALSDDRRRVFQWGHVSYVLAQGCAGTTYSINRAWDVQSGRPTSPVPADYPLPHAVSPDGKLRAQWDEERETVHLVDAATGARVHSLHGLHLGHGRCLAFSGDGSLLAADAFTGHELAQPAEICVWNVRTGRRVRYLDTSRIRLPDGVGGSLLFTGDNQGVVWGTHVLDLRGNGTGLRQLLPLPRRVMVSSYGPTGTLALFSDYVHSTLELWDTASGRRQRVWQGSEGASPGDYLFWAGRRPYSPVRRLLVTQSDEDELTLRTLTYP